MALTAWRLSVLRWWSWSGAWGCASRALCGRIRAGERERAGGSQLTHATWGLAALAGHACVRQSAGPVDASRVCQPVGVDLPKDQAPRSCSSGIEWQCPKPLRPTRCLERCRTRRRMSKVAVGPPSKQGTKRVVAEGSRPELVDRNGLRCWRAAMAWRSLRPVPLRSSRRRGSTSSSSLSRSWVWGSLRRRVQLRSNTQLVEVALVHP